jgi:hypothetical protein
VATRESPQRGKSVLLDIQRLSTLPSGQNVCSQLNGPEAGANFTIVNATTICGMVTGPLTTLFTDLWWVDPQWTLRWRHCWSRSGTRC